MKKEFSSNDLRRLFRMEERYKSLQTLTIAESRGEIPTARRINRGNKEVRKWSSNQLPEIGQRFGFLLDRPAHQQIISVFTQKGGTLKTTLSHSIGRILALHGIKVLIVGLDGQGSITHTLLNPAMDLPDTLEFFNSLKGLYHFFSLPPKARRIEDIIYKTDLPTLDIIPETTDIASLILLINQKTLKEFRFRDELIPHLGDYDVVLFDNGPSWDSLVENSLSCSSTLIQPIGCDVGTLTVLDNNIAQIEEFAKKMRIAWDPLILVPTLKDHTKLSQQIYGTYITQHPHAVLTNSIRKSVAGQEALFSNYSAIEYDPGSDIANDHSLCVQEIWERICAADNRRDPDPIVAEPQVKTKKIRKGKAHGS